MGRSMIKLVFLAMFAVVLSAFALAAPYTYMDAANNEACNVWGGPGCSYSGWWGLDGLPVGSFSVPCQLTVKNSSSDVIAYYSESCAKGGGPSSPFVSCYSFSGVSFYNLYPAKYANESFSYFVNCTYSGTDYTGTYNDVLHNEVYVNWTYTGSQNGTFNKPDKTFQGGVNNVPSGTWLFIKAGQSNEPGNFPMTITKPMTIDSWNGTATIGH